MDFTEIYKQTSGLVHFSPGGHFILTAAHDRIIVRRTDTFQIARTWQFDALSSQSNALLILPKSKSAASSSVAQYSAQISHTGWSCDSEYIFAASAKSGVVQIFKLQDEDWLGRIESGVEGLAKAEWAPDGRTILCFSEWGLRVTVWSLVAGSAIYIQFPLHPDRARGGYAFRSDGRYFILAERHRSRDTLGIYDTSDAYKLVRHFQLPSASLSSFTLSPSGNYVAIWEGPLEYKLYVVSLAGNVIATFSPEPDPGFGIRLVAWHPNSLFLAVGGWDSKIHILDSLSWSPIATLELLTRIPAGVILWREPAKWIEATGGRGFLSYERVQGPQTIPSIRVDPSKPNPRSGAVQLEWNKTGSLLLVRFDEAPRALFIYSFPSSDEIFNPKLRSVLLHTQPVLHARWNPIRKGSLVICCGGESMYTWSDEWMVEGGADEEMAECIGVPAKEFDTRDVRWAPDGKGMVLLDKEQFCCAFEVEEDEGTDAQ